MPFRNFGGDFIEGTPSPRASDDEREDYKAAVRLGSALVQLYSDLLSAKRSLGFLATLQDILYCYIPPEDRTRMNLHWGKVYRADRPFEREVNGTCRLTPQVGLAILAWLAKKFYWKDKDMPHGLTIWGIIFICVTLLNLNRISLAEEDGKEG